MKKYTYAVKGMHCASCEVLIEQKLIQLEAVQAVDASTQKGQVAIYYENEPPSIGELNATLETDGYCLCEECEVPANSHSPLMSKEVLFSFGIAAAVFAGFLLLNRLGLSGFVNVSASSSLPAFFLFGLLAGVSTCAALTGGIVLSMSREWQTVFAKDDSPLEKMKPHFLFNIGRVASYTFLGAFLGVVGSKLQFSLTFSAVLVIAVSVFMILNGLKMLGIKAFQGFQIALPKSLTHKASNQRNFQGKFMPIVTGALTILLPCGFTITAEGLALLSGSLAQGALIMTIFALGTAPGLLAIGFSTVKMSNSPKNALFSKVAGALVLLFAVFNINNQFNVLGLPSLNNFGVGAVAGAKTANVASTDGLAPIVNGKQLLKMQANSFQYSPNYFKVRAQAPVRWEITDVGTSGCTNAIISKGLFNGQIDLTPGSTSIKEFTPAKAGRYKFTCWMGMVSGVIEVVNQDGSSAATTGAAAQEVPSGAKGCGCGGASACGAARK